MLILSWPSWYVLVPSGKAQAEKLGAPLFQATSCQPGCSQVDSDKLAKLIQTKLLQKAFGVTGYVQSQSHSTKLCFFLCFRTSCFAGSCQRYSPQSYASCAGGTAFRMSKLKLRKRQVLSFVPSHLLAPLLAASSCYSARFL